MIKTNRTAIEYVINPDGTPGFNWAIITGCLHPCKDAYCYNTMKKTSPLNRFYKKNRERETGKFHIANPNEGMYPYGFDPTIYPHRLEEPKHRKKPSTIFVANGGDVLGEWIPKNIVDIILDIIRQCPQHTFIILTKNFGRLYEFEFPDNCWVGFSQTHSAGVWMVKIRAKVKFVSFEPLHSGFEYDPRNCESGQTDGYRRIAMHGVNWATIGAETGPREEQFRPHKDWIMALVKSAQDQGIPVFMKNNLAPVLFKREELIQELPDVKR